MSQFRNLMIANSGVGVEFKNSIYAIDGGAILNVDDKYFQNLKTYDINLLQEITNKDTSHKWVFSISIDNSYSRNYSGGKIYLDNYSGYYQNVKGNSFTSSATTVKEIRYNITPTDFIEYNLKNISFYNDEEVTAISGRTTLIYQNTKNTNYFYKYKRLTFYKEDGSIASDFRPAVKDGVCGLYETISGDFLVNSFSFGSLVCE